MDGLIVDTETPDYLCWKEIYERHGVPLTPEEYTIQVGIMGGVPHPADELAARCAHEIDRAALTDEHRRRYLEMVDATFAPRPGFLPLMGALAGAGWPRAVASTASRDWVERILGRLGVVDHLGAIVSGGDVRRGKPHPDVYLLAAERLHVPPAQCVAIEDSAYGIAAARAAGMACVAVPNLLTRFQDLSRAQHQAESLEEVTLELLRGLQTAD